jgi:hypothetical protein
MFAAVVPVQNEEKRLKGSIEALLSIPVNLIIPVINGSSDNSRQVVLQMKSPLITPLYFKEPLGIDVPRAIGAKTALDRGADAVLFLDGDMNGNIANNLMELLLLINDGALDMALTDCYPGSHQVARSTLASCVLKMRRRLNRELGLEDIIGPASPSHGPHAVSRRFLTTVPLREISLPPVSLALAVKKGLSIGIGTKIPHQALGSPEKNPLHSEKIAETIIGDCLEAMQVYRDEKRSRSLGTKKYTGYHAHRRWDLLDKYLMQ